MKRRDFLKTIAVSGLSAQALQAGWAAEVEKKPNFVFLLADDLGWKDIGAYGSSFYETPNIDRLRASGMKFTQAYAACPVCSPTRASIMTGKYPPRVGITDYISPTGGNQPEQWGRNTPLLPTSYNDHLPLDEETIAECLKEAGYATFFAGKWHLGPEDYWPEDQGFDVNKGGTEHGGPYSGDKYFSPYDNPRLEDGPPGEHLPARLGRECADFIKAHQDQPFFTFLSFYSVHIPLMTREDLEEKYQKKAEKLDDSRKTWGKEGERKVRLVQDHAVYAGMVEAMDQAIGHVLDTLDELGLAENTIVFFMSDNGGLSTSEGHPTSNLPLRAGKGWMYEGGIREPMIVRAPGITEAGSTSEGIVTSTDFYPTMLELAGLSLMPAQHKDGVSFVPLLKGKNMDRGPIFWHYPHYGNQGGSPSGAVREGKWKLIEWYEDGKINLFNLEEDIGEKNDVSEEYPEVVEKLHEKLKRWRKEVSAKMPTNNPNYDS